MPNTKQKRVVLDRKPEIFDANTAEVRGKVYKIWPGAKGSVMARVEIDHDILPEGVEFDEDSNENDSVPRLTLEFPDGKVDGKDISLMAGDRVVALGHINNPPYYESLKKFLNRAKRSQLLDEIPQLAAIKNVTIKREMCTLAVKDLAFLDSDAEIDDDPNSINIEGMVSAIWEYGKSLYARVACYDENTRIIDETGGKGGRPRRQAHFVTVQFTDGKVNGRKITIIGSGDGGTPGGLRGGMRIRISGKFIYRVYFESLKDFLTHARKLDVLSDGFPNADEVPDKTRAVYIQSAVEAHSIIMFA
jgi:hypothetical protein